MVRGFRMASTVPRPRSARPLTAPMVRRFMPSPVFSTESFMALRVSPLAILFGLRFGGMRRGLFQ